jgi:organic radical activating enzyme|tara:strand:+ start:5405 stop:6838 length:1434 start_codon:yes stop_codon:yes gene_type:complete
MGGYDDQVRENPVFQETKDKLDNVGCGMCLAKWTQVTLQLQTGHNHSCHHPRTHKISAAEIKRNPSALHNTAYKKKRRREMLTGGRPKECDYCWNVEDNSDRFSDRIFKSNETWSKPHFDEIVKSDWREDFNPRYVEVAFSNACNFKCSYCGPAYSSTWMNEVKEHGGYPTSDGFNDPAGAIAEDKVPINHRDYNPYVEAFWKWWPELYRDLHTFRITGGEPLLSKDTWKVLDFIIEEKNPNKNLQFAVNTNLGVPDELIDKFIEKIQRIEDEHRVKEFIIFTSVDTWGKQAEYIRNGLEFNRFWDNMNKILESCPRVNLTIMSTYNALSVPNYDKLLYGIYDLKRTYGSTDRYWNSAVFLDSSYLRYPAHQSVQVLPNQFANTIYRQTQLAEYMATPNFETRLIGYSDIEVQKIKRIHDWLLSRDEEKMLEQRRNFYRMFSEHDKRRGTNFVETFPELEKFWFMCKEMAEKGRIIR